MQNSSAPAKQTAGSNNGPDPANWWSYNSPLDPDLVVITPAIEGGTGLAEAGELPLAEEPLHPQANQLFLERLREHGNQKAQLAMVEAMAAAASGSP